MLIEEFQDHCLVHGHLLCVNGVILVILSLPKAWRIPPSFLLNRISGLEEMLFKEQKNVC